MSARTIGKPTLKRSASYSSGLPTGKSTWRAWWNVLGWMQDGSAIGASDYG
jgi:hypothetical protein